MQTFYVSADGPELKILDQVFHSGILIKCGPSFGRFIFKPTVLIAHCTFYQE